MAGKAAASAVASLPDSAAAAERGEVRLPGPPGGPLVGDAGAGGGEDGPHRAVGDHGDHQLHRAGQILRALAAWAGQAGEQQVQPNRQGDGDDHVADLAQRAPHRRGNETGHGWSPSSRRNDVSR
jgi:hypothetical protein